ncbi:hypothetical protein P886_3102 [Alteromonadaceae bacterium 2753L.S.0a.02]|nr:hypothetical protein P886_3102 [Alteromonadaceae bacterium 2753L.S.0a.02]
MAKTLSLQLCLALMCGWQTTLAFAQTNANVEMNRPPVFDLDDLGIEASEDKAEVASSTEVSIGGYIQQTGAYRYEAQDFKFSKFQTAFNLNVDGRFSKSIKFKIDGLASYDSAYSLEGRDKFTQATLDTYESDSRLLEAYLDVDATNWFNLRLGRQYFSWGESEGAQISDIGNSRDYRELGLQDVEDARLSVGSSKLTFYGKSWEYNLIALHEFRAHELGAEGSIYDPFIRARKAGVNILNSTNPDNLKDPELLSRLYFSTALGDFSFFVANSYDDFAVFSVKNYDPEFQTIDYVPFYEKFTRFGSFGNFIAGSWLFKYDIAKSLDKPFNRSGNDIANQIESGASDIQGWTYSDYTQAMLGIEYSGLSETFFSVELYRESIDNHVLNVFEDEQNSTEISLYISRDFYNDRMISTFWTNYLIDEDSVMFRIDTTYDINDHLEIGAAITGINSSDKESYFYDYRKTDRIELSIRYSL